MNSLYTHSIHPTESPLNRRKNYKQTRLKCRQYLWKLVLRTCRWNIDIMEA